MYIMWFECPETLIVLQKASVNEGSTRKAIFEQKVELRQFYHYNLRNFQSMTYISSEKTSTSA